MRWTGVGERWRHSWLGKANSPCGYIRVPLARKNATWLSAHCPFPWSPQISPHIGPGMVFASSVSYPLLSVFPIMLRLWPTTPQGPETPRARQEEANPFEGTLASRGGRDARWSPGPGTPTSVHPLLQTSSGSPREAGASSGSAASDLTPGSSSSGPFAAAQPTTQLSLHAPVFNMQQPPQGRRPLSRASSSSPPAPPNPSNAPPASRGQLHIKLIQARALNVRTPCARPYVVVQFEQNEFISREPIPESDKEVRGTPTNRPNGFSSASPPSTALSALGAIGSRVAAHEAANRKSPRPSTNGSFGASMSSLRSSMTSPAAPPRPTPNSLFGQLSAHNPVWKHEVSLSVVFCPYILSSTKLSPQRCNIRRLSNHLHGL